MMEISGKLGMASFNDQFYLFSQKMNVIFGGIQCIVLMMAVFISVFKPWKKKKKKSNLIFLNSNWHFQRPSAKTPPYHRRRL